MRAASIRPRGQKGSARRTLCLCAPRLTCPRSANEPPRQVRSCRAWRQARCTTRLERTRHDAPASRRSPCSRTLLALFREAPEERPSPAQELASQTDDPVSRGHRRLTIVARSLEGSARRWLPPARLGSPSHARRRHRERGAAARAWSVVCPFDLDVCLSAAHRTFSP
jgi:hypothetical protein